MANVDVPEKMLAWRMHGAGMENFGVNDQPELIPVPVPGDGELLVRIEAIGLCFSDVKLIRAGLEHPRVISKDLSIDPVIPGHEAVMSIVKVGKDLEGRFSVGQRFIIQADVYVNGKGFAYGYAINGGMAQYSIIDSRILDGDEGCYLLPVDENTPSAVAALMEPWTCVQASYMIEPRTAPKAGGKALFVFGSGDFVAGAAVAAANYSSVQIVGKAPADFIAGAETIAELPAQGGYDDIYLCGVTDAEVAAAAAVLGARGATVNFVGAVPAGTIAVDVGRIHYEDWFFQGTASNDCSAAFGRNVRSTLKKGGTCWLPGGAGAMGQMHTQMAVENPNGPSRILVSDLDSNRIENVKRQLKDTIAARNIEFVAINPSEMTPEEFEQKVTEFAPEGFDDIVMLVPVVPILMSAAKHLGKDGLMNIFAGIPAGKTADLDVSGIAYDGMRFVGSSGSKTAHLRHTLELAESGKLKPVTALAAIGGMKDLKKGLDAVINARFPGKTVIFPNCIEMPLVPINELDKLGDDVVATLDGAGYYTMATEKTIKERF